jgi:hypothetical protein
MKLIDIFQKLNESSVNEVHSHDDDYEDCDACNGTGEGRWEGETCHACHGSGVQKPEHDDDDFDIPDDDDFDGGDEESYYEKSLRSRGLEEGTSNIGNAIKSLCQKIYAAGDDEFEYFYHDSPVFAQYWDEYEGDLDSIIAEVDPAELQVMLDEIESYVQQANLAEGDVAKLAGITALGIGAGLGANYIDQQQPRVEFDGKNGQVVKAYLEPGYSNRVPDNAMVIKGKDGKTYHVWSSSGKGMNSKSYHAAPVEPVKEGLTKTPSGDYINQYTGVRSSKPPVKKKRGEKTGAEWDAIEKAKKDKEQGVAEGWKEKVAGGALALGALGGIGALQNVAPNVTVQGHTARLAIGNVPENAKLVTTDDGKKVYVWSVRGSNPKSAGSHQELVYKPAEVKEQGVAEGSLNEFAPNGFNGDDGEEFNPRLAKMAYDEGVVKGVSLADGATLERAMAINDWDKHDGGIYGQHFAKGFKQGRMNKIKHDNKQYNLNLKLMKDGSIRHGEQGVAEGEVVGFPKKHRGDISNMHSCPKCGGDTQGGKYQGHEVQVCMPCKQVYLPPNSGIDQQGNKIENEGKDKKPEQPEADYGDDYQAMVARVKKLAGLGPLKTVYDPEKRVYKNVPVAVQPKK